MKKKIWAICLTLVLALAAFAISGCSLFNDVGTISWEKEPKTEFALNSTEVLSFELKVQLKNETTPRIVKYPEESGITVKGFSTAKVGTFTATVIYNQLTLAFSYKVTDGKFADGTGTASDPYMITNVDQFQLMLNQKSFKYYKLANDIDFTGKTIVMANKGKDAANEDAWVGELDGNEHIVRGISKVLTSDKAVSNKYNEVFGKVGRENEKFVLKNITFDFASAGESATMGLVTCNGTNAMLEFNNVNVTGYLNAAHTTNSLVAPYVTYIKRNAPFKSLKFVNCENSIKIYNSYSVNTVAGFAGTMTDIPVGSVEFDGCTFAGRIEGAAANGIGAFFTSTTSTPVKAGTIVVKDNCKAKNGTIVKTGDFTVPNGNVWTVNGVDCVHLQNGAEDVKVDTSLAAVTVSISNDLKISSSVADKTTITKYVVTVIGNMKYAGKTGFDGQFRYMMPCEATDGVLNAYQLKKIAYSDEDVPEGGDATYGSKLIQLSGNNLLYYGKSVCADIKVDEVTKVVVVAYEGEKAVAFTAYTSASKLNFAA